MDSQGAKLSSDTGLPLMRELEQRHNVIAPIVNVLRDVRSTSHNKHSLVQMIRQCVYQMAAGFEECNDADYLRIDPALRLSLDKAKSLGVGQLDLSRFENGFLGNPSGLSALDETILRSADALIKKKDKYRFILDVDSTGDPAYGKKEGCEYKGHFAKSCFLPIVALTGDGGCLAAELRLAMCIQQMEFWISSNPWSGGTVGDSSRSVSVAILPSLSPMFTTVANRSTSPTLSGFT